MEGRTYKFGLQFTRTLGLLLTFTVLYTQPVAGQWRKNCKLGSMRCITVPQYNGSQYATCLTHAYLRQFSSGQHSCKFGEVTFCWYQCMLEVHNQLQGDVLDDCTCDKMKNQADLPLECYSPDGENCSWYTDCLEKRYPCRTTTSSYAIDFAKRFCDLYSQHNDRFDSTGQTWIDAVRKCLQVRLVPTLRPGQEKTCSQLQQFAFNTHEGCYLSPDSGNISVCNLSISDYKQVFWTLKEGFEELWLKSKSVFEVGLQETFHQMIRIKTTCMKEWTENSIEITVKMLDTRNRRSVPLTETSVWQIVSNVTGKVSSTMEWKGKNLMWFGFLVTNPNSSDTQHPPMRIRIILESKALYDLNARNNATANVTAVIEELSNAIETEDLKFDIEESVKVTQYKVCDDYACMSSKFEVNLDNLNKEVVNDTSKFEVNLDNLNNEVVNDTSKFEVNLDNLNNEVGNDNQQNETIIGITGIGITGLDITVIVIAAVSVIAAVIIIIYCKRRKQASNKVPSSQTKVDIPVVESQPMLK